MELSFENIKFFASDGGNFNPDTDFEEIVKAIQDNISLANKLISHTISIHQLNEGFQIMKSGNCARIILDLKIKN